MNKGHHEVRTRFNDHASEYDQHRRRMIPCFDDFYSLAAAMVRTAKEEPEILDMGAGTGILASYVRERLPGAHITMIDFSEKMLEISRKRFAGDASISYIVDDFTQHAYQRKYDAVVSSLAIHHLTGDEKMRLYRDIYRILNNGGIFVNADQVLGHTVNIEAMYKSEWESYVKKSGLSAEELELAFERAKLDRMSTLEDQLGWLREAGFQDVDCVYKYYNFVVLYGTKNREE